MPKMIQHTFLTGVLSGLGHYINSEFNYYNSWLKCLSTPLNERTPHAVGCWMSGRSRSRRSVWKGTDLCLLCTLQVWMKLWMPWAWHDVSPRSGFVRCGSGSLSSSWFHPSPFSSPSLPHGLIVRIFRRLPSQGGPSSVFSLFPHPGFRSFLVCSLVIGTFAAALLTH